MIVIYVFPRLGELFEGVTQLKNGLHNPTIIVSQWLKMLTPIEFAEQQKFFQYTGKSTVYWSLTSAWVAGTSGFPIGTPLALPQLCEVETKQWSSWVKQSYETTAKFLERAICDRIGVFLSWVSGIYMDQERQEGDRKCPKPGNNELPFRYLCRKTSTSVSSVLVWTSLQSVFNPLGKFFSSPPPQWDYNKRRWKKFWRILPQLFFSLLPSSLYFWVFCRLKRNKYLSFFLLSIKK